MSTVDYDDSDSTSTTGVVSGLVGGREYDFVVSALNVGGEGDVSAVFHQSTSPAAPTALHSTLQTTTSITMSWTAPVTAQGAESVTGYVLYRTGGSQGGDVTVAIYETTDAATATTSTTGTSMEVTGLAGGTMYVFSVAAKSDAGLGDRSAVASVSTSSAKPTAPSASHQTASSISLEWSAPTVDTGVSETGYRVYEVSVDSSPTKTYSLEYEGEAAEVELSSLSSGTLYTYVVSVMSDAGESDKSDEMTASTAPGVATALVSTHQSSSSITLSWAEAPVDTGSAVTGYKVYDADGALVYDGRGDTATVTDRTTELNDLEGGTTYTLLVGALSASGESDRSASVDISTCSSAPTALTSVSQTTTGMVLSWSAPAVTSGEGVLDVVGQAHCT